jgi:hypothetical protein
MCEWLRAAVSGVAALMSFALSGAMPTDDPINDATPPGGKLYEQHVSIEQPQDVTLQGSWIRRLFGWGGDRVRAVAARLRAAVARRRLGRPSKYDYDAIITAAEACAARGVDDQLNLFVERVRLECEDRHVKAPKSTQLTKYCRPFWQDAQEHRPN